MYDQYDALIFDMDGTLVDSGQLHEYAWTLALSNYEIPIDRPLMRSLAGVSTIRTVEILVKHYGLALSVPIDEIKDLKEQIACANITKFVKPTDLITIVNQYAGSKPMAVGTGANTEEAKSILTLCGLDTFFQHIIGADQLVNPKPAPDTFLRCAELLGVPPLRCVVFEDSSLGLQAARSAGMTAIDVLLTHNIKNNYFL